MFDSSEKRIRMFVKSAVRSYIERLFNLVETGWRALTKKLNNFITI